MGTDILRQLVDTSRDQGLAYFWAKESALPSSVAMLPAFRGTFPFDSDADEFFDALFFFV